MVVSKKLYRSIKKTGSVANIPGRGRKEILSTAAKRKIIHSVKKDPRGSASKLALSMSSTIGEKVSDEAIRRILHQYGFHSRTPIRKTLIKYVIKQKRVIFAKEHRLKPISFWNTVIFSDESRFNLYGSDGRFKIWREAGKALAPKNTIKTVKFGGGSVLIWGCMSAGGVGEELAFIDGIMYKCVYLGILKDNLEKSASKLGLGSSFTFQQDNDPKHTAKIVQLYLLYHCRKQLHTPDLNIIENLWSQLEKAVYEHEITSKEVLKKVLREECAKFSVETTKTLVESMPRRLQAVIQAKGECEVVGAQWKKEDILDAKIKKFLSQPPNWRPSKDNYRMIRQMMLKLPYKEGVDPSNAAAMVGLRIMGGRLLDAGHVGAVVEKVVRGSTADTVGQIRPGDEILEWNGRNLQNKSFEEVYQILNEARREPQVQLTIGRPIRDARGDRDQPIRRHTHIGAPSTMADRGTSI
ncbi:transposable element Tcb1 transposase [Trichonephila clavipes]|nr:transposable element Tcb1 transposase [Trichonephila clavipes]